MSADHTDRDAQVGPVDEGRHGRTRGSSRRARRSPSACRFSTSKPTRSPTPSRRPTRALLRRKVAAAGDTLPVKALLGVLAPSEVSDADIDAYIAVVRNARPTMTKSDEEGAAAYHFVDVDGIRVRYASRGGDGRADRPCSSSTASAAISTTGSSISTRSRRSNTVVALDLPATGNRRRKLPGTTLEDLAQFVRRSWTR